MEFSEKYVRLLSRSGHLNFRPVTGTWFTKNFSSPYHFILDLPIWQLLLGAFIFWTVVNLIFGGFYFIDIQNLGGAHNDTYGDAFFFSVQTMSTIGYGNTPPQSTYLNSIVFIQAFFALIVDAVLVSLTVGKISRPTRLRHTIAFSNYAIISDSASCYVPPQGMNQANIGGTYEKGYKTLTFRLVNLRKRQLTSPLFQLYLLRKEPDGEYVIHELDFEVNRQAGRSRTLASSLPFLPLPWTIVHKIDSNSPLHEMSQQDMIKTECEIIAIIDAVDELSSHNFQSRWSYLPKEIKWNCKFENMISRSKNGILEVDFTKLSGERFASAIDEFNDSSYNESSDVISLLNPVSRKGNLNINTGDSYLEF